MTNILAYHDTELITSVKSFILEDSHDVATFFSSEKGEKNFERSSQTFFVCDIMLQFCSITAIRSHKTLTKVKNDE